MCKIRMNIKDIHLIKEVSSLHEVTYFGQEMLREIYLNKNNQDKKDQERKRLSNEYCINLLCDICSREGIFDNCGLSSYCHGSVF